jgi:hypothetical protein
MHPYSIVATSLTDTMAKDQNGSLNQSINKSEAPVINLNNIPTQSIIHMKRLTVTNDKLTSSSDDMDEEIQQGTMAKSQIHDNDPKRFKIDEEAMSVLGYEHSSIIEPQC